MTDWGPIGDLSGDPTGPGWSGRQVDPGITSTGKQMDPAMKRFMMNMVGSRIMGDPKLRNILRGVVSGTGFAKNPSKQTGLNLLASGLMSSPNASKYLPLLGLMANPSSAGGMFKGLTQQAGFKGLLKKFGPSALYALTNRGGALGLGTGGPLGQGVLPSLARNPFGTMGRMGFAASNPLIALLMAGLNKASPQIKGQRGPLGGSFGPQLANLFAPLFGGRNTAEAQKLGTGILGGTWGPRIRNALGIGQRSPSIQEFDMSTLPTKRGDRIQEIDMSTLPTKRGSVEEVYTPTGYVPQGAQIDLSSQYGGKK